MKRDGELPPIIPCRDVMPEILMRYGKWDEAKEVIMYCIKCNAYGHTEYKSKRDQIGFWVKESGMGELEWLEIRKSTSIAALKFIKDNPGTLQNKIYKEKSLADFDHESLVWFCRNAHQIKKEKEGKTNRLYAIE